MRERMGKTWVWWAGLPVLAVLLPVVRLEAVPALRLLLWEALVVLGYAASVWDLREKRIPNGLIGLMAAAWVLIVTPFLFLQTDQGAACALLLALSWVCALSMETDSQRQARLLAQSEACLEDEIYILTVPLLEEAAACGGDYTAQAEEQLKEVYQQLFD